MFYDVTTLARYSQYIFYEGICSTKYDYLHVRRLGRRAMLDELASELDMLDSEQGEQGSTCSTASKASRARHARQRARRAREDLISIYRSSNTTPL